MDIIPTLLITCLSWNIACSTCIGETASDCLSCTNGKDPNLGHCSRCDSSCLTCDGTGPIDCLYCSSGLYLQEKNCVSDCKSGFYKTEVPKKQCIKCSITCLTCTSSDFNTCLTCANYCFFTLLNSETSTGSSTYLSCPLNLIRHWKFKMC